MPSPDAGPDALYARRILFGGLRVGGAHHRGPRHRGGHLSPEERERFRERLRERFGLDEPAGNAGMSRP